MMPAKLEWEKVDVKTKESSKKDLLWMDKSKRVLTISWNLTEKAGIAAGDRLDLYRTGKFFMLKKASAGLLTAKSTNGSSKTLSIRNTDLCVTLLAFGGGATEFNGFEDEGTIVFTAKEVK